jgi:hypothetical protein
MPSQFHCAHPSHNLASLVIGWLCSHFNGRVKDRSKSARTQTPCGVCRRVRGVAPELRPGPLRAAQMEHGTSTHERVRLIQTALVAVSPRPRVKPSLIEFRRGHLLFPHVDRLPQ